MIFLDRLFRIMKKIFPTYNETLRAKVQLKGEAPRSAFILKSYINQFCKAVTIHSRTKAPKVVVTSLSEVCNFTVHYKQEESAIIVNKLFFDVYIWVSFNIEI